VAGIDFQRRHYDDLVRHERPTRYGVSCGWHDRFDPALLERRPALRRALEALFDRVVPADAGTVLDLACGTAYYWPLLARRCRRLVGADLSQAMAAAGRRRHVVAGGPPGLVVCAEAGRLPFADGSFDLVLAVDALHHLAGLGETLREVRRVLAPRAGTFVAVEPNVLNPVVLAAHLVPPEERGALRPNHPWAVAAGLRAVFDEVSVEPVTYVSGVESERALRLVELVEPLFSRPPLSWVALRRVYRARRRT
jgi:SAM-dependent methyltransferase